MPAILTDEDIGLDAAPSVSLSDEDIGLTEDHKIVRPPKPGTPPPGYLTPEEVFKSQEKTGLFGGLAEGFTAPMKATARGVGLATLSDETLQEHLLGEYWKATAAPEMTGLGKAGQLIGGLAGTVAQAIPVAAGGARIGGPIGAKAAVMAQFGSMGAYDEFIKAGSQALAEGKTPEEATAIGKKAAIAGAGVGAVMGAVAPGTGQGAMDVLKSAAKMGLVGGAGRGIQNVTERALGLSTPVTQDVAKEAAIMALLPVGMGLARFGLGKLLPPHPIEPEVLPAVIPKRPSGGPGAPVERAPLALPEPTIPDAEIIPPAQLPPPSGTAWPITPPPPRVPPRLTMPIPMGQGEILGKPPRTLAEVEALLRTLKEQEPPSEEPPTGEAGVPVGRTPEPPAPISPPAPGSKPTELPSETPVKETPEVAGGETLPVNKVVDIKPGDVVNWEPYEKERRYQSSVSGIVQDVIHNPEGGIGFNIFSPIKDDPSRVVRVWADRGTIVSRTPVAVEGEGGASVLGVGKTVAAREAGPETGAGRTPQRPKTVVEIADEIAAKGVDPQASYGLFVKARDLKPEIDAKEWLPIYRKSLELAKLKPTQPKAEVAGGEKIVAVASRLGDSIETGPIHVEAEQKLRSKLGLSMDDPRVENIEHGFLTDSGRFVGREEGFEIAKKANQLKKNVEDPGFLGKEDLKKGFDKKSIVAPETTIPEPPKEMFHGTRTAGTLKIGQGKNLNTQGLWLSDYESKASEFSEGRPSDEGIASVRSVEFTPSKTKKVYGPDLKHTDANDLIKQGYDSVYVPDTGFWIALKESAFKEKQPTQPKAEYAAEKIIEQKSVQPERERTDALRPTTEAGVGDSLRAATEGKAQEKAPEVLLNQPWSMTAVQWMNKGEQQVAMSRPEVAQPTPNERIRLSVETLSGPKNITATTYLLPGYKGPTIAVSEYKARPGMPEEKGYRVYAKSSGVMLEDSNGVSTLNDTLKRAVQRFNSHYQKTGQTAFDLVHKQIVQRAIREGKPVPTEVLNDYPELQAKSQPPSKPAEGGGGVPAKELPSPKPKDYLDRYKFAGEHYKAKPNSIIIQFRGLDTEPLKTGKPFALKFTGDLAEAGKSIQSALRQAKSQGLDFSYRETPIVATDSNGNAIYHFRYNPAEGKVSATTHAELLEARRRYNKFTQTGEREPSKPIISTEKQLTQPTTPPTSGGEGKPAKTLMERYEAGETLSREEQRELRKSIAATEPETPEVKAETGKRGKTLKEIREAEERRKQEGSFTLQPLEPFVRKAAEHLDKLRAEMGILLRNGKMLEVMTYKKDAANNAAQQYARRIKNGLGKSLFNATGTKYDPFKESRAPTTVRTILMPWEDPQGVQKTALTVGQESFSEAPPNSPEEGVTGLPRLQMQRQKLVAWQPPNEKLGKWKNSLIEGLDYAIANWTRIEPTVRRYDAEMRMQAQAEVNAKVDTLIRSGYVMHAQDVQGLSDFDFLTGRGSGEAASFLKKRYHPTYVDSVMAGVEPRSLDALALAETRIRLGQQKINSRAWTQELRSMTDKTSGNPILTEPQWETRADGKEYPVPPTKDYTIVHMGYQPFAIHKGYETAFKDLTSPSAFTDSLTGRTLLRAAAGTKHIVLAFDTFHLGRLALWSAIYNKGLPAYKKGFVLLDNTVSDLRDMAQRGDIPAEYLNDILENKRKIGLAFKTGYNVTRIQDALWQDWMQKLPVIGPFNKFLFGQFQRGAMMQAWLTEFERQRKEFPWLSEADTARKVSKSLNTRFGNLQSQGVFRSKTMQDVARMLFLAPQWNEGLIRSEIGAAKELGEVGSNAILRRKFAVGTLLRGIGILFAAQFAANQLINFATRGHSTLDNPEEGLDAKMSAYIPDVVGEGPGLFISPMALPLETTHLIGKKLEKTDDFDEAFRAYARTRLGTLARPLNTWWTGKDVFGKPIREGELWGELLKDATPAPISGSAAFHAGRQVLSGEKAEQFPGQFQRQAMASFGMKTEGAPTAAQQIGALAQKFNKARGQREIPKQFADYAELDRLLRVGNYKDAQKALDELRTKRKDKDIINRFKVKASSGFTHGSKAVEGQFYNSLTEEQKTAYFNARKEQQDLVSRFYKLWAQSPKQP